VKSVAKCSAWVVFAALLCFAPCAFGQGTVHNRVTGAGSNVLRDAPSSFLAFAVGPSNDFWGEGGNKGCGDRREDRDCKAVPEGGTTLTYVLLAGLSCLGAMVLRFRRQAGVR